MRETASPHHKIQKLFKTMRGSSPYLGGVVGLVATIVTIFARKDLFAKPCDFYGCISNYSFSYLFESRGFFIFIMYLATFTLWSYVFARKEKWNFFIIFGIEGTAFLMYSLSFLLNSPAGLILIILSSIANITLLKLNLEIKWWKAVIVFLLSILMTIIIIARFLFPLTI